MSGTVNISRTIWSDVAFKPEPFSEREAFIWLIMEASYKPREKRVGVVSVFTERGQIATSVRFMSEAWGWSKSRVDRYLNRLKNRDMIGTDSGTGINVITICKYDEYQNTPDGGGTARNKKRDSSGTAAGQQRDKPNKGLIPDVIPDVIQDLDSPLSPEPAPKQSKPKRAVPIPENWAPNDANIGHALSKNLTEEEIRHEADRFRDHHLAKGTCFKDWDAGWRTWVGNAIKFRGGRMAGNKGPGGYGQGGSIASVVARRQFGG